MLASAEEDPDALKKWLASIEVAGLGLPTPKTNSEFTPENKQSQMERFIFQPSFFRGYVKLRGFSWGCFFFLSWGWLDWLVGFGNHHLSFFSVFFFMFAAFS